jgi:hypothetical protein
MNMTGWPSRLVAQAFTPASAPPGSPEGLRYTSAAVEAGHKEGKQQTVKEAHRASRLDCQNL